MSEGQKAEQKVIHDREEARIELHIQTQTAPLDPDQEWAKVMRKLSFKMPQTFKYSFVLFASMGFIHCVGAKRASMLFVYPLIGTPIMGLGLCYNDFMKMYQIKYVMPQNKSN